MQVYDHERFLANQEDHTPALSRLPLPNRGCEGSAEAGGLEAIVHGKSSAPAYLAPTSPINSAFLHSGTIPGAGHINNISYVNPNGNGAALPTQYLQHEFNPNWSLQHNDGIQNRYGDFQSGQFPPFSMTPMTDGQMGFAPIVFDNVNTGTFTTLMGNQALMPPSGLYNTNIGATGWMEYQTLMVPLLFDNSITGAGSNLMENKVIMAAPAINCFDADEGLFYPNIKDQGLDYNTLITGTQALPLPHQTTTIKPPSTRIPCSHLGCNETFTRKADRDRHFVAKHNMNAMQHLCPIVGCVKGQDGGYKRADKLTEHLWKKHGDLGYVKGGK